MATTVAKQNKMKRNESRKSHSWWWDSHISPKKNKWLQENLEVMDGYVKRMLKLIEEDADSFAKKAEMYYKKRPELINLVEDFYRMYRALAERYDIVSGELRKRGPSDLQSQSSGFSDTSSDHVSTLVSPDQHIERHSSGPRAAGFDIFLGGGNKSEQTNKVGDESSGSDSESESDDSSVINYAAMQGSDEEQGLRKRITELEAEINEVKEKYRLLEEENKKGSQDESKSENTEALLARLTGYEEQLNVSTEKIRLSEEEINKLKDEVQKYQSLEESDHLEGNNEKVIELEESNGSSEVLAEKDQQIRMLEEDLKITKEKFLASETNVENMKQNLQSSELSIQQLQDKLGSAENDVSVWKTKLEEEEKAVSELQDRIVKYQSDLSDRDQEIIELKEAVSDANKTLSEEKSRLQTDIDQLLKEKIRLENNLKEMDFQIQSLLKDVSRSNDETEKLKVTYETLLREKKAVDTKMTVYITEISSQKNQIIEMNKHLNQLHMEHVELIVAAEGARMHAQEMRSSVKELEQEVEKQKEVILQGAEEKREAIRQLCLSLEYYRNGYHRIRKAVVDHKRLSVMVS